MSKNTPEHSGYRDTTTGAAAERKKYLSEAKAWFDRDKQLREQLDAERLKYESSQDALTEVMGELTEAREVEKQLREQLAAEHKKRIQMEARLGEINGQLHKELAAEKTLAHAFESERELRKRYEDENKTFRAAQKACEDCDGPTMAEVQQLREQLADNDAQWKAKVDHLQAQLSDNDEQWKNQLAAAEREKQIICPHCGWEFCK